MPIVSTLSSCCNVRLYRFVILFRFCRRLSFIVSVTSALLFWIRLDAKQRSRNPFLSVDNVSLLFVVVVARHLRPGGLRSCASVRVSGFAVVVFILTYFFVYSTVFCVPVALVTYLRASVAVSSVHVDCL